MAEAVQIAPGSSVKIRNPWLGLLWSLLTVGIYVLFWWYSVNRELRDLGRARGKDLGQRPGQSVVAITIGALIIVPPLLSYWGTGGRIAAAQELVGIRSSGTKPLFFVLTLFTGVFGVVYGQYQLNDVWREVASGGTGASGGPAPRMASAGAGAMTTPQAPAPGWSAPEAQDAFGRVDR